MAVKEPWNIKASMSAWAYNLEGRRQQLLSPVLTWDGGVPRSPIATPLVGLSPHEVALLLRHIKWPHPLGYIKLWDRTFSSPSPLPLPFPSHVLKCLWTKMSPISRRQSLGLIKKLLRIWESSCSFLLPRCFSHLCQLWLHHACSSSDY